MKWVSFLAEIATIITFGILVKQNKKRSKRKPGKGKRKKRNKKR